MNAAEGRPQAGEEGQEEAIQRGACTLTIPSKVSQASGY